MPLQTREAGAVTILSVDGSLTKEGFDDFLHKLNELNDNNKICVVINFEKCNYINSSVLSIIFQLKKRLLAKKGDIRLACLNSTVKNLLKSSNLSKVVDLFESVEAAVDSFKA